MKKKVSVELKITISFFIVTLIAVGIIFSYGMFNIEISGTDNVEIFNMQSKQFLLRYDETTTSAVEQVNTGEVLRKSFSVENTGQISGIYDLIWSEILNEFNDQNDLVYSLTCSSNQQSCNGKNPTVFPYSTRTVVPGATNNYGVPILTDVSIEVGEKHTYTLVISYIGNETNQNDNLNSDFSGKILLTNALSKDPTAYTSVLPNTVEYFLDPGYCTYSGTTYYSKSYCQQLYPNSMNTEWHGSERVNVENVGACSVDNSPTESACVANSGSWTATDVYYFTGSNVNNFVNIDITGTPTKWRIIEFSKNGRMKLIAADAYNVGALYAFGNCNATTTTAACSSYNSSLIKRTLETSFLSSLSKTNLISDSYTFETAKGTPYTFENLVGVLSNAEYQRAGGGNSFFNDGDYWLGDVGSGDDANKLYSSKMTIQDGIAIGTNAVTLTDNLTKQIKPTITVMTNNYSITNNTNIGSVDNPILLLSNTTN